VNLIEKTGMLQVCALFAWLISYQPAVLFSQNKPATSNQPTVLFSPNKSAPAISHQPNEQAVGFQFFCLLYLLVSTFYFQGFESSCVSNI
jgi:hypothetical protein